MSPTIKRLTKERDDFKRRARKAEKALEAAAQLCEGLGAQTVQSVSLFDQIAEKAIIATGQRLGQDIRKLQKDALK